MAGTSRGRKSSLSSAGRRKAAVLPLPVTALPQMSRPASAMGMAFAWMAVGVTKPIFSMPLRIGRERFSCVKSVSGRELLSVASTES